MDLQSVDGGYSDWFTAVEWIWMVIKKRMILWSVVFFAEEDQTNKNNNWSQLYVDHVIMIEEWWSVDMQPHLHLPRKA